MELYTARCEYFSPACCFAAFEMQTASLQRAKSKRIYRPLRQQLYFHFGGKSAYASDRGYVVASMS